MAFTEDEINWIYCRTAGRCFYCGMHIIRDNHGLLNAQGAWDINYFIPKLNNGERCTENWVPACVICDTVKGECFPWEYDSRRFRQGDENPDNYIKKENGGHEAEQSPNTRSR